MQQTIQQFNHEQPSVHWDLRVGINSGSVIAGVIGRRKFSYDLWGDTVNIAARMEQQGMAGHIQISEKTRDLIEPHYRCVLRGPVDIKGKGVMRVWYLEGLCE